MGGFLGALRLQLQIIRADRSYLNEILANPFFAVVFLGVIRAAGRDDLASYALVAPVLITMWGLALEISGEIIASDRWLGILEEVVATPAPLQLVVVARVLAVSLLSTVAVAQTWLVARVGFGVDVVFDHWPVMLVALVATSLAMTGTAVVMAAGFVLARASRLFQNTLNYPIFLLAGVLVPVSFLPAWIRPVGRLLFLSWSADLMRDALQPGPVADFLPRVGLILGLGAVGFIAGTLALNAVLRRVRQLGTIGNV